MEWSAEQLSWLAFGRAVVAVSPYVEAEANRPGVGNAMIRRLGHEMCHLRKAAALDGVEREIDQVGHRGGTERQGIKYRQLGDRWGGWRLTSDLTLEFEPGTWKDYWVDLQRITNVWEALDIIAHLIEKEWMTPQDLGDFIYALNDCIPLRERLLFRSEPYHVRKECPWLRQADNE